MTETRDRRRAGLMASMGGVLVAVVLGAAASLACRSRGERGLPEPGAAASSAFDWAKPETALAMSGDEAAARLGSFEQSSDVGWSVSRGPGTRTVAAREHHRVRQLASGELEVESAIDPGGGPSAEAGRTVVYAEGMTYARSRFTAFRERPTDRGRDARRARDESFGLAGDLATLCGPALALRPAGDATVLGRAGKQFTLGLRTAAAPARTAPPGRSADPDTKARLDLLEGATPVTLDGELTLDAATGVPLSVRFRATFALVADPALRADVDLDARMIALGGAVAAVRPPKGALPDARKPNGPARALEAAGLRAQKPTRGVEEAPEEEPAE